MKLDDMVSAAVGHVVSEGAQDLVRCVRLIGLFEQDCKLTLPALGDSLPNLVRLECDNVLLSRACVDSLTALTSLSLFFCGQVLERVNERKLAGVLAGLPELKELVLQRQAHQLWRRVEMVVPGLEVLARLQERLCAALPLVSVSLSPA